MMRALSGRDWEGVVNRTVVVLGLSRLTLGLLCCTAGCHSKYPAESLSRPAAGNAIAYSHSNAVALPAISALDTTGSGITETELRPERIEIEWWHEWDRSQRAFCPGQVSGSKTLPPTPGTHGEMCWAASFQGRLELGRHELVAPPDFYAAVVTCFERDGSPRWVDHWVISEDNSPRLDGLSGNGTGQLALLLDSSIPARVRLYDAQGRIERRFTFRSGRDRREDVGSLLMLDGGGLILGLIGRLGAIRSLAQIWTTPLPDSWAGGAWLSPTTGGSVVATYYAQDVEGFERFLKPAVVAKFSPAGKLLWRSPVGEVRVTDVAIGPDDSAVVVGAFYRPFPLGPLRVQTRYEEALFIASYNRDGKLSWLKTIDVTRTIASLQFAIDRRGMMSLLLSFSGTLELEPPLSTPGEKPELWLIRMDRWGRVTLTWSIETTWQSYGTVAVDSTGALWLQLHGLSPDFSPAGPVTLHRYEPGAPARNGERPPRCALAKARFFPETERNSQ